jgi:hypothetical protein
MLREVLDYDPLTGIFAWKISPRYGLQIGSLAGNVDVHGYRRIGIDGESFRASHLAIFYVTGEWPYGEVDHVNNDGPKADDRLCNLRSASKQENGANRGKNRNNTSGYKRVSWAGWANKWRTSVKVHGRQIHIGYFDTRQKAHLAYRDAARKHFGSYAHP